MKMKTILLTIFAAALLCGIALAQDTTSPASGTAPQEPQTPAASPSTPAQDPSAQPAPPSQSPQPQQAPDSAQQPTTPHEQQTPAATQPSTESPTQTPMNGPAENGVRKVAPGSVIPVQLTKTIDAKKAKTGDEVVAKVTQDLKTNSGETLLSKDTRVVGHVTEAQARSKEQKESQLGITFDRAVMKNGSEMQMPMSIQAIIVRQNDNPNAGGNDQGQAPGGTTSPTASGGAGRPGTAGSTPPPTASTSSGGGNVPADAQAGANSPGPITAQTQGVVGTSNFKLESAGQSSTQGSMVTSDKNNVKLESGTMMLLRVNP